MWKNIGGTLVNMDNVCYITFEEELDGIANAILYFTDYSGTLNFEGKSVEKLRSAFERIVGINNDTTKEREETSSQTSSQS